ncbi:hypothetical protein EDD22DRAFT_851624 [Suillus occidentalis]|nr:hypothetical protein EDD22DRAFT_851624 [Suillus occidentalis]
MHGHGQLTNEFKFPVASFHYAGETDAVFTEKFRLLDHLSALNHYLLLGYGDFAEQLMESLRPSFAQPANTIYRHNLRATLETAIRISNAQNDPPDVFRRLDPRMLECTHGELGWEMRVAGAGRVGERLEKMIHFIRQMQAYTQLKAIECSWKALMEFFARRGGDLDAMIDAHQSYLDRMDKKESLLTQVREVSSTILQFREAILSLTKRGMPPTGCTLHPPRWLTPNHFLRFANSTENMALHSQSNNRNKHTRDVLYNALDWRPAILALADDLKSGLSIRDAFPFHNTPMMNVGIAMINVKTSI